MSAIEDPSEKEQYFRLIAFWAVCEAFAGGVLHAFKMPFTGLLVSSLAVLSICLIGRFCRGSLMILKATMLVCIFKFMLSPHSPPTAYIAVGFQGLMGQIIFSRGFWRGGAILLGALALVESSLQRLLVLLVIYGNGFWEAVDIYLSKTFDRNSNSGMLKLIASGYVFIHFIAGLTTGYFAGKLASSATRWKTEFPELIIPFVKELEENMEKSKKKGKGKLLIWILFIFLLFLYMQSVFYPSSSILSSAKALMIFLRASLILGIWYLVLGPLLKKWMKLFIEKNRDQNREQVRAIIKWVPHTRHVFLQAGRMSADKKGIARLKLFFRILVINIV